MALVLYGIPNCDKVRKARKWLDAQGLAYRFHDVRDDGLAGKQVARWIAALGWEAVINRRSTSWKALDAATREAMDDARAVTAILAEPTLIKRPLLEHGELVETGFDETAYRTRLL